MRREPYPCEQVECPGCGAGRLQRCITPSGRQAAPHGARMRLWRGVENITAIADAAVVRRRRSTFRLLPGGKP